MLLPLANTLPTVKVGLSNTNAPAEAGQRGCNSAGTVPLVITGKKGSSMASPKTCCFPGAEASWEGSSNMHKPSSQKIAWVHWSTFVSHPAAQIPFTASVHFWGITRISSQFPLFKSHESWCEAYKRKE